MSKIVCLMMTVVACMMAVSCDHVMRTVNPDYAAKHDQEKALAYFIENTQYMTEREALSKEINYYRAPKIIRQELIGTLSGKTLIHIANEMHKEDENKPGLGPSNIRVIRNVSDVKEYGLDHPNEQVAKVYIFGGDFVHYNKGMSQVFKIIVYIPEIDRLIEVDGRMIDNINTKLNLNSDQYRWFWSLPSWSEQPL